VFVSTAGDEIFPTFLTGVHHNPLIRFVNLFLSFPASATTDHLHGEQSPVRSIPTGTHPGNKRQFMRQ
jgi:hypothetical protein